MKSFLKKISFLPLLIVPTALAQQFCNPLGSSCNENTTIEDLLTKVVSQMIIIAIPLLAIVILYGAYTIMTSEGNEEKYSQGKKIIIYGIIGFTILAVGSGIGYIIRDLLTH